MKKWYAVKVSNKIISEALQKLAHSMGFTIEGTNSVTMLGDYTPMDYLLLTTEGKGLGWISHNIQKNFNLNWVNENAIVISMEEIIRWLEDTPKRETIKVGEYPVLIEKGQVKIGCKSFTNDTIKEMKRRLDEPIKTTDGTFVRLYMNNKEDSIIGLGLFGNNERISIEDFNKILPQLKE